MIAALYLNLSEQNKTLKYILKRGTFIFIYLLTLLNVDKDTIEIQSTHHTKFSSYNAAKV